MRQDMPVEPGRSRAVSTDVADTIEGMLPELMDISAGSDEVVRFEAVGPADEESAAQETDYAKHVHAAKIRFHGAVFVHQGCAACFSAFEYTIFRSGSFTT
jgi:hypothetical protein